MRTSVSWIGPFYISVLDTEKIRPLLSVGRSWTTVIEEEPHRGAGVLVKIGRLGVSVGVFSAWLQEKVIPKTDAESMRVIWETSVHSDVDPDLAGL